MPIQNNNKKWKNCQIGLGYFSNRIATINDYFNIFIRVHNTINKIFQTLLFKITKFLNKLNKIQC